MARVSLRAVAKASGVSIGTASQALRNEGDTSRVTAERVREIARKLGYKPNPLMASLASRQFRAGGRFKQAGIAFVANPPENWAYRHAQFLSAMRKQTELMGFRMECHFVKGSSDLEQLSRQLFHKGVLGVVFGLFLHQDWLVHEMWEPFSIICCGGRFNRPLLDTVKVDVGHVVRRSVEMAISKGFKRIGLTSVRHHGERVWDDDIREGVINLLHDRLPETQKTPIFHSFFGQPDASLQIAKWFNTHKPDIVVGMPVVRYWLENGCPAFRRNPSMVQLSVESSETQFKGMGFSESEHEVARIALERIEHMIRHGIRGFPEQPTVINVIPREWTGCPSVSD